MKRFRVDVERRAGSDPSTWDVTYSVNGVLLDGSVTLVLDRDDEPLLPLRVDVDGAVATTLRQILDQIARREHGDIEELGRLLFDTLIDAEVWSQTVTDPSERVVLELCWANDDGVMNGLPWESMRDHSGFLALHPEHEIVIVRVVAGTTAEPRPIDGLPHVLFAIGSSLLDRDIRAGAEVVSLLRDVDREGCRLLPMIIDEASTTKLAAAVQRHRPNAVHLIGHGATDPEGKPGLRVAADAGNATTVINGLQLANALQYTDEVTNEPRKPGLVVLSSCDSARAWNENAAPLAAELVHHGVPMVVAMAGRVSDAACRLFMRGFGRGLITGAPLAVAAATGRRAAFQSGASPQSSIDWALPTVFLSAETSPDHVPLIDPDSTASLKSLLEALELDEPDNQTVFYGRRPFFARLEEVLLGSLQTVVAMADNLYGLGGNRLLRELGRAALQDGVVPLYLKLKSDDVSFSYSQLLVDIEKQMLRRRSALKRWLASDRSLQLLSLVNRDPLDDDPEQRRTALNRALDAAVEDISGLDVATASDAVVDDLMAFARDCRDLLPATAPSAQPLLLLPNVHNLGEDVEVFFERLAGDAQRNRLAVVATASRTPLLSQIESQHARFTAFETLAEFNTERDEDLLAYSWVLMNPRADYLAEMGVATKAWGFERPADERVTDFRRRLRWAKPLVFDETIYQVVNQWYGFIEFDDDLAIKEYVGAQR